MGRKEGYDSTRGPSLFKIACYVWGAALIFTAWSLLKGSSAAAGSKGIRGIGGDLLGSFAGQASSFAPDTCPAASVYPLQVRRPNPRSNQNSWRRDTVSKTRQALGWPQIHTHTHTHTKF